MKLANKVAVVTGAGRGIGRAIAELQAQEGARVALIARTAAEVEAAADAIRAAGGTAHAYAVDVVDGAAVAAAFAVIESDLGPVTLLTNNAGAFSAYGPIWTVDPDAWRRDVETNLFGTFNCCRAALPGMIARGRGRVIVMTGGGAATSFPMGSGYATSKAGLLRFAECVADTLIGTGVLVFAMDPGLVRTAMTQRQLESEAGRKYLPDIAALFERDRRPSDPCRAAQRRDRRRPVRPSRRPHADGRARRSRPRRGGRRVDRRRRSAHSPRQRPSTRAAVRATIGLNEFPLPLIQKASRSKRGASGEDRVSVMKANAG